MKLSISATIDVSNQEEVGDVCAATYLLCCSDLSEGNIIIFKVYKNPPPKYYKFFEETN